MEVIKVEVVGDNINIVYADGSRERIENGFYELRDADGDRIERHRATADDYARLQTIVDAWEGDTASDDGTADQGTGDATPEPGTDDGTPDQGTGDATSTGGTDDGTPDQGTGDATPTPGTDDGTADQGTGDATPTGSTDDGTPDQGSGDSGVGDGGGVPLNTIDGTDAGERIRGTRGDDEINGMGGNDRLDGRGGNDVLNGGDGDDEVRGDWGDDVVNGNAGNDDLWGEEGADTFVFSDGGQDKIHDFEPGIDKIDVSAYAFADAAAVLASAWQDGLDTYVDLGGGDLIKIDDVPLAMLSEDDFIV